jgi:DME family drug/metabolite transporter
MQSQVSRRAVGGVGSVAIAALTWGTVGIVAVRVESRSGIGSESIAFLRVAIAAAILVPVAVARNNSRFDVGTLQRNGWLVATAGVALACNQLFYFLSIARIGVGAAALVTLGLSPIAASAIESAASRRLPDRPTVAAMGIAITGLGLLAQTSPLGGDSIGIAYGVASAICFALVAVSRHALRSPAPNAIATTAATMFIASVILLPIAGWTIATVEVDAWTVAALAYIGIGATAAAYLLYFRGLESTPASAALVIVLLEPVTASALGIVVEDEPLSIGRLVGSALLLVGILLASRPHASHRQVRSAP